MGTDPRNDPKPGGPQTGRGNPTTNPGASGGESPAPGAGRDTTGEMEDAAGGR
jgi:hypothetical protein